MATRRRFTQEYQDQAVSLVLHSGRTIRDVARSIGVHEITLAKWVSKARGGDSGQDKELSETEREELACDGGSSRLVGGVRAGQRRA